MKASALATSAACVAWYATCCTVKTLLTKWMFSGSLAYPYPLFYSSMSCAVTALAIALGALACGEAAAVGRVPPRARCGALLGVVALTALDMGLTNLAVEALSVPLQQTFKAVLPAVVVGLERLCLRKTHPRLAYAALVPITLGPALAGLGPRSDATLGGVLSMMGAVLCSALKNISLHSSIKAMRASVGVWGVTLWLELLMLPLLLGWSVGAGELWEGDAPMALTSVDAAGGRDYSTLLVVSAVALLGGVRAHATNLLLRHCSAATLAVANVRAVARAERWRGSGTKLRRPPFSRSPRCSCRR